MKEIIVNIKNKEHIIYLGESLLKHIEDYINREYINGNFFIITDSNVSRLYLNDLIEGISSSNLVNSFIINAGEKSKTLKIAGEIYSKMIESGCNRETTIIALGGGVVGDIAGFVAATYMRGISHVQIPTTLLSQVDSSIGGKVALNHSGYKNIVGAFYQPRAVIIDVSLLQTLDRREMVSGVGEVIKYGLIEDYDFFMWIRNNLELIMSFDKITLLEMIHKSINIKKIIVQKDEKDNNIRRILNFGHTIGHGIEALDDFTRYRHGEAVILGIMYESLIAKNLNLISNNYYQEIIETLCKVISPVKFSDREIETILLGISHDKKTRNGRPVFILPTSKGKVKIFDNIDYDNMIKCLKDGIKYDNLQRKKTTKGLYSCTRR